MAILFIVLCIFTLCFAFVSNMEVVYITVVLVIVLYPLISYIISEIIIGIKFSKKVKADEATEIISIILIGIIIG